MKIVAYQKKPAFYKGMYICLLMKNSWVSDWVGCICEPKLEFGLKMWNFVAAGMHAG